MWRCLGVDTFPPVTGIYPDNEPCLPLLTASEAREAIALLMQLSDSSREGMAADHLAHMMAMRMPVVE
ncbi:hypothetical protein [Streptomyces sp. NBC_00233]|uniref:hypothetical protein n=1 Tax=Streptomyces sp. NBC_00233 TaxID=2975686 RepID=UPI00225A33E0|nr:hypothetical protein [Streptomyces sp. NBC_00233]MCX5229699.1 hypothetical protein [Streptomyces sp. NBC_00233]